MRGHHSHNSAFPFAKLKCLVPPLFIPIVGSSLALLLWSKGIEQRMFQTFPKAILSLFQTCKNNNLHCEIIFNEINFLNIGFVYKFYSRMLYHSVISHTVKMPYIHFSQYQ